MRRSVKETFFKETSCVYTLCKETFFRGDVLYVLKLFPYNTVESPLRLHLFAILVLSYISCICI
jgi:hypothetical protein